jgi:hypothetical protein
MNQPLVPLSTRRLQKGLTFHLVETRTCRMADLPLTDNNRRIRRKE